jgi:hypothetical protein
MPVSVYCQYVRLHDMYTEAIGLETIRDVTKTIICLYSLILLFDVSHHTPHIVLHHYTHHRIHPISGEQGWRLLVQMRTTNAQLNPLLPRLPLLHHARRQKRHPSTAPHVTHGNRGGVHGGFQEQRPWCGGAAQTWSRWMGICCLPPSTCWFGAAAAREKEGDGTGWRW